MDGLQGFHQRVNFKWVSSLAHSFNKPSMAVSPPGLGTGDTKMLTQDVTAAIVGNPLADLQVECSERAWEGSVQRRGGQVCAESGELRCCSPRGPIRGEERTCAK